MIQREELRHEGVMPGNAMTRGRERKRKNVEGLGGGGGRRRKGKMGMEGQTSRNKQNRASIESRVGNRTYSYTP